MADVIPGVSGGTLALILGIYEELIATLDRLHLHWVRTFWNYVRKPRSGLKSELLDHFREMNLGFLLTLVAGVITAVILGSLFIPELLANYPVGVRGFFFGLILGSVWIPYTLMEEASTSSLFVSSLGLVIGALVGFFLANPNLRVQSAYRWETVESKGETLGEILYRSPAALPAQRIVWNDVNHSLRSALFSRKPGLRDSLIGDRSEGTSSVSLRKRLKLGSEPYENLRLPEGTSIRLPKLHFLYVFGAGFTAISAMVLPGISGSYILLILGAYFYVMFSLKSLFTGLVSGMVVPEASLILVTFLAGMLSGLVFLAKLLNYLLSEYRLATLGVLTGLMIGCLRGVWPFRRFRDGTIVNQFPSTINGPILSALLLMVAGCLSVGLLTVFNGVANPELEAKAVEGQ